MAVIKETVNKTIPYLFGIVKRSLIIPQMIQRVPDSTFKGNVGDTVTMKIPGLFANARTYEWRTRAAPIVLDDIQGGGSLPIKLDTHIYSATGLTDEHFTLDDIDFVREVAQPQAEAVANKIENLVVAGFNSIAYKWTIPFAGGDDPLLIALEAQRLWGQPEAGMLPSNQRYWLMGTNVYAAIVSHPRINKTDSAPQGVAQDALVNATLGRIGAFNMVVSNAVDPNFSVFMDSSCMVLGNVPGDNPRGATYSRSYSQDGFAMRWLMDYDANYLRDRSIVSSFMGLSFVYDERKGGTGTDRYQLKYEAGDPLAKTVRAIKVDFTPATVGGSVLP